MDKEQLRKWVGTACRNYIGYGGENKSEVRKQIVAASTDVIWDAREQELREQVAKWEEAGRVVWKGVGTVVHFKAWAKKPPVSWVEFGSALDSDLDVLPLPPGTGTDGERVRITVTKEE